jgi:DNA-directed RNA polymerase specialized sigma24 family protein
MSKEAPDAEPRSGVLEAAFQALPPLGSAEYLAHIDNTSASNLPPEVLVRALRQLPAGSVAWEATLARLFRQRETYHDGQRETHWDYLGPLVAYARRQAKRGKRDEYADLLQDALAQILKVLPTQSGAFGERAWHAFCRRELSNAWRARHGRRGERFPRETPAGLGRTENEADPLAEIDVAPPWHAVTEPNSVQLIEGVAQRVLGLIQDEFVRAVAEATWFNTERPKVSGRWDKGATLLARFPGKSRYPRWTVKTGH